MKSKSAPEAASQVGPVSDMPTANPVTSLSGEWVPLAEAIAWVSLRDFVRARRLRDKEPRVLATEYAWVSAQGVIAPPCTPLQAESALLEALRAGRVSAQGREGEARGAPSLIGTERWAGMKLAEFPDRATGKDLWCAEGDKDTFHDVIVQAEELLVAFPPDQTAPGEAPVSIPIGTGAPGRPSSASLVDAEFQARVASGRCDKVLSREAKELEGWLRATYPNHPRMTARTIENRIRGDFNRSKIETPRK